MRALAIQIDPPISLSDILFDTPIFKKGLATFVPQFPF
jgi:hypothetical protein